MNGRTRLSIGLAFVCSMALAAATHAQVFVGSYQVDDGPFWGDIPDVLTAQEAAAVVFGGDAGDYRISTDSSMDPGTITDTGWYGTIGVGGGEIFAHDFKLDGGGFVGSYQVDDGPFWGDIPDVLTAQEAAAVVFGGDAGDYRISTDSSMDPGTITDTGWYGTIGVGGGEIFAHDFKLDGGGAGYGAAGWVVGEDISAYVTDNAIGPKYTNYVWTPAPGALALFGLGAVFTRRRRRA